MILIQISKILGVDQVLDRASGVACEGDHLDGTRFVRSHIPVLTASLYGR